MYVPLCTPWPLPPSGCPDLTTSPAVSGYALTAASEVLWMRTGYRFGSCEATIRPCRQSCAPAWAADGGPWWWDGNVWPILTPGSSLWWNAICGCRRGCSCNDADTLTLPDLVQSITSVVVDGVELTEGTHWLLYGGRQLVRTDGLRWPMCQDWTVTGGPGAWSITVVSGQPVPMIGSLAVGELAAEIAKGCNGGPCRLPAFTTSKSRQGVTQNFPSAVDLAKEGLHSLPIVNEFIQSLVQGAKMLKPRIWNPDDYNRQPRQPGGAW